jgi:hypothetical protein
MIRKALVTVGVLALLSSPAIAFHCPKDIKAIDAAMGNTTLNEADKAAVKRLRDEGEALHIEGKHKEAVDKLAEAMRILLTAE